MSGVRGRTILVTNPGADLYGSDRMTLETVAALVGGGARVVVAVHQDGPLVPLLEDCGAEVVIRPTVIVRKSLRSLRGMVQLVTETLRTIGPGIGLVRRVGPDLVYVNTVTSPLWCLIAWLLRRPLVCHVHEGEATASPFILKVLNAPLLLSRRVIVNSEFSRSVLLGTLPRLRERTEVVYNAVAGPPRVTRRPGRTR